MASTPNIGDEVSFKPGPRSASNVTARITGFEGQFLITKDADGKVRKVRKGATTPV